MGSSSQKAHWTAVSWCFLGAHCVNWITSVLEHEHWTIYSNYINPWWTLHYYILLLKVALPQSPPAPTRYTFLKITTFCFHVVWPLGLWGTFPSIGSILCFAASIPSPLYPHVWWSVTRMSVFNSFQWFHVHHTPFLPFQIWFQFQENSQETLGQKIHCYPINTYTKSHSTPMIPMKSSCGSGWIMHTDYRWL